MIFLVYSLLCLLRTFIQIFPNFFKSLCIFVLSLISFGDILLAANFLLGRVKYALFIMLFEIISQILSISLLLHLSSISSMLSSISKAFFISLSNLSLYFFYSSSFASSSLSILFLPLSCFSFANFLIFKLIPVLTFAIAIL